MSSARATVAPSSACERCRSLVADVAAWNAAHAPTSALSFDTFARAHPELERVDELPSGQDGPVELWRCRRCATEWSCMLWFAAGHLDVSRDVDANGAPVTAIARLLARVRQEIPVAAADLGGGRHALRTPGFEAVVEVGARPPYRVTVGARSVVAASLVDAAGAVVALLREARRG